MHEGQKLVYCERTSAICNNEYREYSRDGDLVRNYVCPRVSLEASPLCSASILSFEKA